MLKVDARFMLAAPTDRVAEGIVDACAHLGRRLGMTLAAEGVVLYANPGALPEAQLADLVAKVREVDMDDVRAQITAQAQGDDSPA